MRINTLCGQGQYSGFYLNDAAAQEITYITGAESAEIPSGGMRINVVPEGRRQQVLGHASLPRAPLDRCRPTTDPMK